MRLVTTRVCVLFKNRKTRLALTCSTDSYFVMFFQTSPCRRTCRSSPPSAPHAHAAAPATGSCSSSRSHPSLPWNRGRGLSFVGSSKHPLCHGLPRSPHTRSVSVFGVFVFKNKKHGSFLSLLVSSYKTMFFCASTSPARLTCASCVLSFHSHLGSICVPPFSSISLGRICLNRCP